MVVSAQVVSAVAGVHYWHLLPRYVAAAAAITFLSVLITVFCWTVQLAALRSDDPVGTIKRKLRGRVVLLILPVFVFPVFLASYTGTKTAIPFVVGYGWDAFWTRVDELIFQWDAWRISHAAIGPNVSWIWAWMYTAGWGLALYFVLAFVAAAARPRSVGIFYTAMLATWFLGGFVLAYAVSAAGPVFAHLVDPALGERFMPLRDALHRDESGNVIRITQQYLAAGLTQESTMSGGGISAMPSMHIASATIYVLAARRTKWMAPAIIFWAVIFFFSAYFGYHYWCDGIVAAAVALVCWRLSERLYRPWMLGKELIAPSDGGAPEIPVPARRATDGC